MFVFLTGCQLKSHIKTHGIIFLKIDLKNLIENKSNKNDVIKLIGQPHTKSLLMNENNGFILKEHLQKVNYHKLGKIYN